MKTYHSKVVTCSRTYISLKFFLIILLHRCCGIFHCVWNISAFASSINNQDCIFHFLRFAFVHSYVTNVLNILPKITMLTSFIATTSKRLDWVCPTTNRTWQRLTIVRVIPNPLTYPTLSTLLLFTAHKPITKTKNH